MVHVVLLEKLVSLASQALKETRDQQDSLEVLVFLEALDQLEIVEEKDPLDLMANLYVHDQPFYCIIIIHYSFLYKGSGYNSVPLWVSGWV